MKLTDLFEKNYTDYIIDSSGNPKVFYHGTSKRFDKFDPNMSASGTLYWFADNPELILSGTSGAASSKVILTAHLKANKLAGWDEYDKYMTDQLIHMGYDGLKLDDVYVVFDVDQIEITGEYKLNNLDESFKMLGPSDIDKKDQYKDIVWDIIQKSYKNIGGIYGSGFDSPSDMISIPLWKLATNKDGEVVSVRLYKDRMGRKSIAGGTDGSRIGKEKFKDMMINDLNRSYSEISKGVLHSLLKELSENEVMDYIKTPEQASEILNDTSVIPIKNIPMDEWPDDAKQMINKYPFIENYGYVRDIGDKKVFKVMVGTIGLTI